MEPTWLAEGRAFQGKRLECTNGKNGHVFSRYCKYPVMLKCKVLVGVTRFLRQAEVTAKQNEKKTLKVILRT